MRAASALRDWRAARGRASGPRIRRAGAGARLLDSGVSGSVASESLGWAAPCSGAARSASAPSPSMSATASVASTSPAALASPAAGGSGSAGSGSVGAVSDSTGSGAGAGAEGVLELGCEGHAACPSPSLDLDGAASVLALPGDRALGFEPADADLAELAQVARESLKVAHLVPELGWRLHEGAFDHEVCHRRPGSPARAGVLPRERDRPRLTAGDGLLDCSPVIGQDLRELLATGSRTTTRARPWRRTWRRRGRRRGGAGRADVGCGTGRSVEMFRSLAPSARWVGVDLPDSPEVRMRTRSDAEFHVFDGLNLPFEEASFDVVYCAQVLEHARHPESLLIDVARVLSRGARWRAPPPSSSRSTRAALSTSPRTVSRCSWSRRAWRS